MDPRYLVAYGKPIFVDRVHHMDRCTLYLLIFSALRVFALWDRNVPMTLLVLALNLVPVAVNIFLSSQESAGFTADPIFGTFCDNIVDFSHRVYFDLQPILISRFLLNLRQVGSPEIDSQEAFNSQFSVPGFCVPTMESIIGNMGENLDHGGPTEEVEDEVENISGSVQAEDVEAENTSGSVQAEEVALPEIAI
ncbi:hypothetical protein PHLCEN_2v1448 [Hermanssonia centrifuga]|uniref:Uncharacterized protein n=1 Tax=Hermanssonia centrifuga TaxID=98765 RepID=A0A2R6RZZ3_9APHY|nr:hypothetical protein PHLCEN_2v1448 [Hermanssonia centrifuga]